MLEGEADIVFRKPVPKMLVHPMISHDFDSKIGEYAPVKYSLLLIASGL